MRHCLLIVQNIMTVTVFGVIVELVEAGTTVPSNFEQRREFSYQEYILLMTDLHVFKNISKMWWVSTQELIKKEQQNA